MLHTLLLQATTHTTTVETASLTNVYIAMGATLGAALVAAGASIFATFRTTKTAGEVASLQATVTRESSTLAARTAQELKDKDYKNDFYKRIIEKRLKAWEQAEDVISSILSVVSKTEDGKLVKIYRYFLTPESFDEILTRTRTYYLSQNLWLGGEYAKAFINFRRKLVEIRKQCTIARTPEELELLPGNVMKTIDPILLTEAGIKHFKDLSILSNNIANELAKQIQYLHNIEDFFEQLPRNTKPSDKAA